MFVSMHILANKASTTTAVKALSRTTIAESSVPDKIMIMIMTQSSSTNLVGVEGYNITAMVLLSTSLHVLHTSHACQQARTWSRALPK